MKQLKYQIKGKKYEKIQRILFVCDSSKVENIEVTIHYKLRPAKSSFILLHLFNKL
jgi:hypothetical protein